MSNSPDSLPKYVKLPSGEVVKCIAYDDQTIAVATAAGVAITVRRNEVHLTTFEEETAFEEKQSRTTSDAGASPRSASLAP